LRSIRNCRAVVDAIGEHVVASKRALVTGKLSRPSLLAIVAAVCLIAGFVSTTPARGAQPAAVTAPLPIYRDTHYSFAERAADLVSRMTLPEKVLQLHTNDAPAIPRLGVQRYTYWSEGQHGINRLGADTNHGTTSGDVHATSFPTNFASSMSWDRSLVYAETTAISDEARGFLDKSLWDTGQNNIGPDASNYGSLTYWAPTVNLDRDPRWGRTDEAFGEDPYLVSQMAGAFVDGYQGQTLNGKPTSKYLKVASTAKHYALNNVENNRTGISSDIDDATLHDYYTAQFASLIENAGVSGLMTSYNAINGTPAVANTYTVNQLAQRTYGFDGYITSDCGAVGTTYQTFPSGHDWAPPGWTTDHQNANATWTNTATGATVSGAAGGQAYALRAGTGLNCTGAEDTVPNITEAIKAGVLSEGVIDTALVRIFTIRMRTGEFDPPSKNPYTKITKAAIESPAHQQLAEKVAANSLVLLKNNPVDGKPLLPASNLNKVVILGDLANKVSLGGYSGSPTLQVNAVQGITDAVKAASPNASVVFDAAGTSTTATGAATLSAQTQADIKSADLVLLFAGTDDTTASEGRDRTTIAMPGNYDSLINQASALGNDKLALVIQSDGPVKIDDVQSKVPAILFSGYNGESQGSALADVLLGKQNPDGHLNFTWYKDDSQLPAMSNYELTPSATGGLGRTYQYFTGTPTYPFGYGLSYSNFSYSHVVVDRSSVSAGGSVTVHANVRNTGTVAGSTVAQLYVSTPFKVSGVELPDKRLEGFAKTRILKPGATQHIAIPVKVSDLAFWDPKQMKSVVHNGRYEFQLGADASNIAASRAVDVHGRITPKVRYVTVQPESVTYQPGDTIDLTGKNRWIKDDTDPTQENRNLSVTADNVVEAANNDGSFANLKKAQVRYRSSDTAVATVSKSGVVKTIGAGVATISVTVNGVTGTAVINVKQPFSLDAPAIVTAGTTVTATTTLHNTGAVSLTDVTAQLTGPAGWTVTATSPATFAKVDGGQTAQTTWSIAAPAGAKPGNYPLAADATYRGVQGRANDVGAATQLSVPYPSFTSALTNPGISDDAQPSAGNLDGGGYSYSAQALATAGLTPGATINHGGLTFTWPNAAAGTPDNAVAGGQTIGVSGSGTKIGFLGTGDYGAAVGGVTITYTDGSTQTGQLGFSDWWTNSALPGGDVLASAPYINTPSGKLTQQVSVYYASLPLQSGKTVKYVTLPDISATAVSGATAMHIFAISTA